MGRYFSLLCCLFLLVACTVQTGADASGISGVSRLGGAWQDQDGQYYYLEPGGKLGLPGQIARSGLTWAQFGDRLFLNTLDVPGGSLRQSILTINAKGLSGIELTNQDGQSVHWEKRRDLVATLKGTASYNPGINLPADLIIRAQLFVAGQDHPFATSLTLVNDPDKLDFTIHYLKDDAPAQTGFLLTVDLFHESECLLSLPQPINVNLQSSPQVRLQATTASGSAPEELVAPLQFSGEYQSQRGQVTARLFLEADGLYILDLNSSGIMADSGIATGRWQQINRNYSLQLSRDAEEPLLASVTPSGNLLFALEGVPGGDLELNRAKLSLDLPSFVISGNFNPEALTMQDCSSGLVFPIKSNSPGLAAAAQMHSKAGLATDDPIMLRCEVKLTVELGRPQLELIRVQEVLHGEICGQPYASVDLENTYWRLVKLNAEPVSITPELSEPHLILRNGDLAVGSDGCNNFFLPWQQADNSLTFEQGASTLMLCAEGADLAEAMQQALQNTREWKIIGKVLELSAEGRPLATFEAVEL